MVGLLKTTSAWLPIAMSLAALLLVIGYILIIGIHEPQADEGAAARIYQLLLGGQIPIIIYFVIKWLPKKSKEAIKIITLQVVAALLAFSLVFFLEL